MTPIREELEDWLRIPSVSTGGGDADALGRACDWVLERIEAAGGSAERVVVDGSNPMAVGELRASRDDAPTVLSYGHYDVQDPGPLDAWESPPFDPTERDGRLYARGAADDKGNFLPLLHVACELARAGELPVNVRLLVEGEEEIGSSSVLRYLRDQPPEVDAAIVFDSLMADERTPAINTGARGLIQGPVEVRTGRRDLHSGLYGGAVPKRQPRPDGDAAGGAPGPRRARARGVPCRRGAHRRGGARVVVAPAERRGDARRGGSGGGHGRSSRRSSGCAPERSPLST